MTREITLAPVVASVGAARRFVNEVLSDWDLDGLVYTAELLTSEVLTNSVLHARTAIDLTVERSDARTVTISVHDRSKHLPRRRRHAQDATTGRGMELLDRLASSWRVTAQDDGKTVSFTVGTDVDPWAAYAGVDWMDAEL